MTLIHNALEYYMAALIYCFPDNDLLGMALVGFVLLCVLSQTVVGFLYLNILNDAEKWIHNGCVTSVSDKVTKR